MSAAPVEADQGLRKAVHACVALGAEGAAAVMRHLPPALVERLTVELAKAGQVDPDEATDALEELYALAQGRSALAAGGPDYARQALAHAFGRERAEAILDRLSSAIEEGPFEFLRHVAPEQIHALLRSEGAQTIAYVVANLPTPQLKAKLLGRLQPDLQVEVAMRIARLDQVATDVARGVAELMQQNLVSTTPADYVAGGGPHVLAGILNSSTRQAEKNVLVHLADTNPALADEVRGLLFVFEDLATLDDRALQLLLREVDAKQLALALRTATDELRARLTENMSQRAAEILQQEMEYAPPQRRHVVEEAQAAIVAVARRLEEAGTILLTRTTGTEDEIV